MRLGQWNQRCFITGLSQNRSVPSCVVASVCEGAAQEVENISSVAMPAMPCPATLLVCSLEAPSPRGASMEERMDKPVPKIIAGAFILPGSCEELLPRIMPMSFQRFLLTGCR